MMDEYIFIFVCASIIIGMSAALYCGWLSCEMFHKVMLGIALCFPYFTLFFKKKD